MSNKGCPPGSQWDNLLNACIPYRMRTKSKPRPSTDQPLTVVAQLRSTDSTAQLHPAMELNPALSVFVTLTILGSVLALVLWFIIYRQQRGLRGSSEEPQQEPLHKADPGVSICSLPPERTGRAVSLQSAGGPPGPPPPCSHLHQGAYIGSQREEGITTKHAGTEGSRELPAFNTVRETRIPLPATELGGAALVTTKTV